jgi:hypothetical protein
MAAADEAAPSRNPADRNLTDQRTVAAPMDVARGASLATRIRARFEAPVINRSESRLIALERRNRAERSKQQDAKPVPVPEPKSARKAG